MRGRLIRSLFLIKSTFLVTGCLEAVSLGAAKEAQIRVQITLLLCRIGHRLSLIKEVCTTSLQTINSIRSTANHLYQPTKMKQSTTELKPTRVQFHRRCVRRSTHQAKPEKSGKNLRSRQEKDRAREKMTCY